MSICVWTTYIENECECQQKQCASSSGSDRDWKRNLVRPRKSRAALCLFFPTCQAPLCSLEVRDSTIFVLYFLFFFFVSSFPFLSIVYENTFSGRKCVWWAQVLLSSTHLTADHNQRYRRTPWRITYPCCFFLFFLIAAPSDAKGKRKHVSFKWTRCQLFNLVSILTATAVIAIVGPC